MTLETPIPKNLKLHVLKELEHAPDEDFVFVNEAMLHGRKLRLLDQISEDAEKERAAGKWEHLPELLASVRAKLRSL